jgi:hypothetical protein
MFGYPVTCEGGEYKIVEGLPIDAFSQECINKTLAGPTTAMAAWGCACIRSTTRPSSRSWRCWPAPHALPPI